MNLPHLTLPLSPLYILYQLKKAGFEAFLVGGSVRDLFANSLGYYSDKQISSFDFDFTTNARPEEIMVVFPDSFYENEFGTVSLAPKNLPPAVAAIAAAEIKAAVDIENALDNQDKTITVDQTVKLHESLTLPKRLTLEIPPKNFEITTYRIGEKYELNCHQPSTLAWGNKITDDLSRRDFTVNALALTFSFETLASLFYSDSLLQQCTFPASSYQLIDHYQSLTDLKDNLIRAIGDPRLRFQEDALRLLRAVRLSVQLNFSIQEETYLAIKDESSSINHISDERIRDEFLKILASDYPKEGIMLLHETGLLDFILPELVACRDIAQSGHHLTDVWIHSLDALNCCPNPDPIVRLATLLHDVGKPVTQKMLGGQYTFYNHQVVGAHLAKQIAQRLRLSKNEVDRIFILVRQHMFHYQPENTDASIRRFMRQVGLENLNDILDVREADRLGSNARRTSWRLEEMKQRMISQLHQPLQVRDLAIDGHDLMKEFSLKPGPILGRILNQLLEEVLENSDLNCRAILIKKSATILQNENS